jgi:predicted nuclease with RNAse H fold
VTVFATALEFSSLAPCLRRLALAKLKISSRLSSVVLEVIEINPHFF